MMCERDEIAGLPGESGVTQLAGGCLDAVLVAQSGNIHSFNMQGNIKLIAESATKFRPIMGIGTDAVVDVQGGKPPFETRREGMQQMQQNDGIHAAAQADQEVTALGKKRRQARRNGIS